MGSGISVCNGERSTKVSAVLEPRTRAHPFENVDLQRRTPSEDRHPSVMLLYQTNGNCKSTPRSRTPEQPKVNNFIESPFERPFSCRQNSRFPMDDTDKYGYIQPSYDSREVGTHLPPIRISKHPTVRIVNNVIEECDELSIRERSMTPMESLRSASTRTRSRRKRRTPRANRSGKSGRRSRSSRTGHITDASDSDVWSIPDETVRMGSRESTQFWESFDGFNRNQPNGPAGGGVPMYRVVSEGSESKCAVNNPEDGLKRDLNGVYHLAKTASERSISSVLLTTNNDLVWGDNHECCDATNTGIPDFLKLRLENLEDTLLDEIKYRQSRRELTESDYESITQRLRHQLLDFIRSCKSYRDGSGNASTPLMEVWTERSIGENTFDQDMLWRVHLSLQAIEDEALTIAEKHFAQQLFQRGRTLSRDCLSTLLAAYLETLESLQNVASTRKPDVLMKLNSHDDFKDGGVIIRNKTDRDATNARNERRLSNTQSVNMNSSSVVEEDELWERTVINNKSSDEGVHSDIEEEADTPMRLTEELRIHIMRGRKTLSLQELSLALLVFREELSSYLNPEDSSLGNNFLLNQDNKEDSKIYQKYSVHFSANSPGKSRKIEPAPQSTLDLSQEFTSLDKRFIEEFAKRKRRGDLSDHSVHSLVNEHSKSVVSAIQNSVVQAPSKQGLQKPTNLFRGGGKVVETGSITMTMRGKNSMPLRLSSEDKVRPNRSSSNKSPSFIKKGGAEKNADQAMTESQTKTENKYKEKKRPDSGIAVSTSSGSYSSSEVTKEIELDECNGTTWVGLSYEQLELIEQVRADDYEDVRSLARCIVRNLSSDLLCAQALYRWLACQDINRYRKCTKRKDSPRGRLKMIAEKTLSYSTFYVELARAADLQCEKVEGFVKHKHYRPGEKINSSSCHHTWNVVLIDGHYQLLDCQFGALPDKFFIEHYFMTPPDEFRLSHFPKDKKWLLMNQPMTIEDFTGMLTTWPAMFAFNIRPLNMRSVIRTFDGKLSITVLLRDVAVTPYLEFAEDDPELDSDSLSHNIDQEIRTVDNAETFHMSLPKEGFYYFTLLVHDIEDDRDIPAFQYKIEYKDELL